MDVEKILQAMYPDDLLFQQKMLEKVNQKAYLGRESDAAELAALVHTILEEIRQKRDVLYKESVRGLSLALLIQIVRINSGSALLSEGGLRQKRGGFDQVRPALEYIRSHYAQPMKISELLPCAISANLISGACLRKISA